MTWLVDHLHREQRRRWYRFYTDCDGDSRHLTPHPLGDSGLAGLLVQFFIVYLMGYLVDGGALRRFDERQEQATCLFQQVSYQVWLTQPGSNRLWARGLAQGMEAKHHLTSARLRLHRDLTLKSRHGQLRQSSEHCGEELPVA